MKAKDFKNVILFMANQWTLEVSIKIYGEDLGRHFYNKWYSTEGSADDSTMRLFYEMTDNNIQLLLDYIESHYEG